MPTLPRPVSFTKNAQKVLARLDRKTQERIVKAIETFAATGRGNVKRLQAVSPPTLRLRIGDWRVRLVQGRGGELVVAWVGPRGGAYK